MSQNHEQPAPADDGAPGHPVPQRGRGGRLILLIAAVGLAALGLLALVAVLVSSSFGAEAWPGFVLAAYVCLPLGFLLMAVNVIISIRLRGRA